MRQNHESTHGSPIQMVNLCFELNTKELALSHILLPQRLNNITFRRAFSKTFARYGNKNQEYSCTSIKSKYSSVKCGSHLKRNEHTPKPVQSICKTVNQPSQTLSKAVVTSSPTETVPKKTKKEATCVTTEKIHQTEQDHQKHLYRGHACLTSQRC